MPPRIAKDPCSSTGSSGVKPASASKSASASGSISVPARIAIDASSSRFAGLTRGRSAAAEAMTSRAVPVAAACSARARAAATRKWGLIPRYGSTWSDGSGNTAASTAASDAPSSAPYRNRASEVSWSTSLSLGAMSTVRPDAVRAAATAASAFAGGVSPAVVGASLSKLARAVAWLSSARSVREAVVAIAVHAERPIPARIPA